VKSFFTKFTKTCPKTGKFRGFKNPTGMAKLLFPIIGIAAIVWILVRVIPKPSRAQYPCMKVAAPIASGFIVYVAGLAAAVFSFKKARIHFRNSRTGYAIVFVIAALIIGLFTILKSNTDFYAQTKSSNDSVFVPFDSANSPIGVARGIFPGRVAWMHDPSVTTWDGKTGNWWDADHTHQAVVDSMLSRSLHSLSGQTTDSASWISLFKYFNQQHGKGNIGYQAGEKIAVKINLNNSAGPGNPGNTSVATPQMVFSLLKQLVNNAGVPDSNISFYDIVRFATDPIYNTCKAQFPHVHFVGWTQANGRELYVRDSSTQMHWAQPLTIEKDTTVSAKGGNTVFLPTVATKASYLINLANLKGHSYAGMTATAKNHFGSLSVDDDFGHPYIWAPHAAGVHAYVVVHQTPDGWTSPIIWNGRPMGSYNPLVDLMGHKDLGGKTMLFLIDALYAQPDEHATTPISNNTKWLSAPFNDNWTCSLFLSQDEVAIESVALDFLRTEQAIDPNFVFVYGTLDNYLREAALADNPPSGTFYAPSGDGVRLQSLGVHEVWNNAVQKQYSRNLGTGDGIELVQLTGEVTAVQMDNKVPGEYVLNQNYPNPFNPTTTINYSLQKAGLVTIKIYDAIGRYVKTLVNTVKSAGNYSVQFSANGGSASGRNGSNLSSGVYFYRMQSGNFSQTKKLILLK
jgi:hypothetical protein